jgi:hypothetical protein
MKFLQPPTNRIRVNQIPQPQKISGPSFTFHIARREREIEREAGEPSCWQRRKMRGLLVAFGYSWAANFSRKKGLLQEGMKKGKVRGYIFLETPSI